MKKKNLEVREKNLLKKIAKLNPYARYCNCLDCKKNREDWEDITFEARKIIKHYN